MFEKVQRLKEWAIEQVIWAEKHLDGTTGAEKKAAVIKKLDDMITLPGYLEWLDDVILAKIVDLVCDKLNERTQHDFKGIELDESQEREIASEIKVDIAKEK